MLRSLWLAWCQNLIAESKLAALVQAAEILKNARLRADNGWAHDKMPPVDWQ